MSTYTPYGKQIKQTFGENPDAWSQDPGLNANFDQVSDLIKLGAGIVSATVLTPTYVSATTFTVLGDRTAEFAATRKLYVVQSASTWVTVSSSSYSGATGKTTVTIGTSTLINAALTVYLSLANPSAVTSLVKTIAVQLFTGSGTYTKPATLLYAWVRLVGGGGGGGASDGSSNGGGGGGGGGYADELLAAASIGGTETVTVGTGGGTGAGGNTSSFGSLLSATGGAAGPAGGGGAGGLGGLGSGGHLNVAGGHGGRSVSFSTPTGVGGGSALGAGAIHKDASGAGNVGRPYGGGGSGGYGTSQNGGAGANGVVIVVEYLG